jgi:hypothetical protein
MSQAPAVPYLAAFLKTGVVRLVFALLERMLESYAGIIS